MIRKKKFYSVAPKSCRKNGVGIAFSPENTDTCYGCEVEDVIGLENVVFELRDGIYTPYLWTDVRVQLINKDFKNCIEQYLPKDYPLEFLPIHVTSKEYGDKLYFFPHFKIIFDVIDVEHSKIIPETGSITVPCIDYEKAKDLDFFNSSAYMDTFIVSDKIKREMKKNGWDYGLQLWEWKSV